MQWFVLQWTTDQDIANAVHDIGVNDFHEVKFFEHRANGQSKGFCVISMGSESSMRLCMDLLPNKEINGQSPSVTLPTKQALSNFESQSKTRPSPTNNSNSRPQHPNHGNNSIHPGNDVFASFQFCKADLNITHSTLVWRGLNFLEYC